MYRASEIGHNSINPWHDPVVAWEYTEFYTENRKTILQSELNAKIQNYILLTYTQR